MMYKALQGLGKALAPVVGPVHDALGKPEAIPSEVLFAEGEANAAQKSTLEFYVGGTALVVAGLTLVLCKKKKPMRRRRSTPAKRRTYKRRR